MSGFNRITKERYLEIKEDAKVSALEHTEKEDKAMLVEERKKEFTSEDERIVFIGNLYFPDDDEFLKDYNMYSRNIKLMADNYDVDTYINFYDETKTNDNYLMVDKIHLTKEGNEALSKYLKQIISN